MDYVHILNIFCTHFFIFAELFFVVFAVAEPRFGVKRKWDCSENKIFLDIFEDEIKNKKMAPASKLQRAAAMLTRRSTAQIRTRIHNIIKNKQKLKL